jgi:hypothetical protein
MLNISPEIQIAPKDMVGAKITMFGKSKSGKTNTMMVICEELLRAGFPLVILDPVGYFRRLALHFSILVAGSGAQARVDLTTENAAQLADFAFHQRVSVLLDARRTSHEVLALFFERFWWHVDRQDIDDPNLQPWTVVIDEAHNFAPQGANAPLIDVLEGIATRGRHAKCGMLVATQRPALIEKTLVTQSNMTIIHRSKSADISSIAPKIVPIAPKECMEIMSNMPIGGGGAIVEGDPEFMGSLTADYIVTRVRECTLANWGATDTQVQLSDLRPLDDTLLAALAESFASGDTSADADNPLATKLQQVTLERDAAQARIRALEAELAEVRSNVVGAVKTGELIFKPPMRPVPNGNGHNKPKAAKAEKSAPTNAADVTNDEPRSSRATAMAASRQQRAWDGFKHQAARQPKWHLDLLIYLSELELRLSVRDIARNMDLSMSTIHDHPPKWFLERRYLARESTEKGFVYRSRLREQLAEEFPDLDCETMVDEIVGMATNRVGKLLEKA